MILLMLRGFVNGHFECEFYAFNRHKGLVIIYHGGWGQGRRDRGGVGGVTPPLKTSCRQMKGFVGKQKIIYHKTLSYIRFTVGQYWLRIKN